MSAYRPWLKPKAVYLFASRRGSKDSAAKQDDPRNHTKAHEKDVRLVRALSWIVQTYSAAWYSLRVVDAKIATGSIRSFTRINVGGSPVLPR